jgi:hypothetical protein
LGCREHWEWDHWEYRDHWEWDHWEYRDHWEWDHWEYRLLHWAVERQARAAGAEALLLHHLALASASGDILPLQTAGDHLLLQMAGEDLLHSGQGHRRGQVHHLAAHRQAAVLLLQKGECILHH